MNHIPGIFFASPLLTILIIQGALIAFYHRYQDKKEDHLFDQWFPSRLHFLVTSIGLVLTCYSLNIAIQLYCTPVSWASTILFAFLASLFSYPFLSPDNRWGLYLSGFLGSGLFILPYIAMFMGELGVGYLMGVCIVILFTLPLSLAGFYLNWKRDTRVWDSLKYLSALLLLPLTGLAALLHIFRYKTNLIFRMIFLTVPLLMFLFFGYTTSRLSEIYDSLTSPDFTIEAATQYTSNPLDRHLLELALGAHWKYHTRFDIVKGIRPPFHDPILGVAEMFVRTPRVNGEFPEVLLIPNAKEVYHTIFPENDMEFDCSCAAYDYKNKAYHQQLEERQ